MKLSEKIVFLRKRKGMSQEALANELDVSRQAVYKWETGITTPEIEKLKKISEIFEVSFDDLLNDKIDISNPPVVSTNTEEVVPPPPPRKNPLPFILIGIGVAALVIASIIVLAIVLGNKHEHTWGESVVETAPTCTVAGKEKQTCTECGESKTSSIPTVPHSEIPLEGREPTCSIPGLTDGKSCSVCNATLVNQKEIPKNNDNHTPVIVSGYGSTCTRAGLSDGEKCAECSIIIKKQTALALVPHETEIIPEIKATCIKTGLTEGEKCSVCQEIIKVQEVIPVDKSAHVQEVVLGKKETCVESGLTDGVRCKECHNTLQEQTVIPPKGHTELKISSVLPTCSSVGYTEGVKCSTCDMIIKEQTEIEIDPNAHNIEILESVLPTCSSVGYTEGEKCTLCEATLVLQNEISMLPHTEIVLKRQEPTCEQSGLTEGKSCSVCKAVILKQEVIEAKGHTEITLARVEADCESSGLTEGKTCSVCNKIILMQVAIPPKGHSPVTTEGKPSTCTENGAKDYSACSLCKKVLSTGERLPLAQHTVENDKCTVCGLEANTNLTFTLNEDGESYSAAINDSVSDEVSIIIPSTYNGKAVTRTFDGMQNPDNAKTKSIYLPSTITVIDDFSFAGFNYLERINIPNGVTYIGADAIAWCKSLTELYIPNTVKTMVLSPFDAGNPNMILFCQSGANTTNWDSSFWCHYTVIHHNNRTEMINYTVIWFEYVDGEIVEVDNYYYTLNDDGSSYTIYMNESVSNNSIVVIPSTHNGLPVTAIGQSAFEGNKEIQSVYIPSSIKTIGGGAFAGCSNLSKVTIESGIEVIESNAFSNTAIKSIYIPNTITTMGAGVFDGCVTALVIRLGVAEEGEGWHAWWNANGMERHQNIYWNQKPVIDEGAFAYILNSSGTEYSVIAGSEIDKETNISIPTEFNGLPVTEIGDYGFSENEGILSVYVPSSIKKIGFAAFGGCTSLSSVTIESGVNEIGTCAFVDTAIMSIYIPASVTLVGPGLFDHSNSYYTPMPDIKIYCEAESQPAGWSPLWTVYGNEHYQPIWGVAPANPTSDFIFTLNDDGKSYSVKASNISETSIVIPSTYKGLPVTQIKSYGFANKTDVKILTIPNTITSIGDSAFLGCTALEEINFNATAMEDLSSTVFYNAGKDGKGINLKIGKNVTKIPANLFNRSSFDSSKIINVVFEEGSACESIGSYAFSGCSSLEKIAIPDSLKSIEISAFSGCSSLNEVHISNVASWCNVSIDSTSFLSRKDLYLNGILVTDLIIPDTVTEIKAYTFSNGNFKSVTIGNGVMSIEEKAFYGCDSLEKVTIGNNVTSIGTSAFEKCTALEEINFNATAMEDLSNDNSVFSYAGQNGDGIKVTIGKNVTKIPAHLFDPKNRYSVSSPPFPKIISVTFEEDSSCESIGEKAFYRCDSLEKVTIGNNVTSIGYGAFSSCTALEKITIPDSVATIEASAFSVCRSLSSVTLGSGLESIGKSAFEHCSSLTKITIPKSVASIETQAFYCCYNLVEVYNLSSLDMLTGTRYHGDVSYYAKAVHTSLDKESIIKETNDGYVFAVVSDSEIYLIDYIGNQKELTLPKDYNGNDYNINSGAFFNRDDIIKIDIPATVTTIGDCAFYDCQSLEAITLPQGLKFIGNEAFMYCESLTSITIPSGVTTIGDSVFAGCNDLKFIIIPKSVEIMGSYIFSGCTSLTIYCEASGPSSYWDATWNNKNCPVMWNYSI